MSGRGRLYRSGQPRLAGPARTVRSVLCVGMGLAAAAAAAQVPPSQVTPPSLRPSAEQRPGVPLTLPATVPALAPPGAQDLSLAPGPLQVEGEFPALKAEREALAARWLAPARIRVSDLFELAADLEAAYSRAGHVLARVSVPAQALTDGSLIRLVVTDGRIEALDLQAVPAPARRAVQAVLAPLVGQPRLTLSQMEQALWMAGDLPGLRLRSALAPGQGTGGVRLLLSGDFTALEAEASVDNRLSEALGRWQLGGRLSLNSPLGLGEQLWVAARTSRTPAGSEHPALRLWSLGLAGPPDANGVAWSAEWTDSRTQAQPAPGALETVGQLSRWQLRAQWPVWRTSAGQAGLAVQLESVDQRSTARLFGIDLNHDDYRVVRIEADLQRQGADGVALQGRLQASAGVGGRQPREALASGVPLSRQGAQPDFAKLQGNLTLGWPMGASGWLARLNGSLQTSFNRPMLQPEQLSLDGEQAVAGLPPSAMVVDEGAVLRAELRTMTWLPAGLAGFALTPYGHVALAEGRIAQPTALETPRIRGRSVGLGLRADWPGPLGSTPMTLNLEWTPKAAGTDVQPDQRQRWTLRWQGRF